LKFFRIQKAPSSKHPRITTFFRTYCKYTRTYACRAEIFTDNNQILATGYRWPVWWPQQR